jgi:colanic acid biosynthesis glycosyl transferase WcaI
MEALLASDPTPYEHSKAVARSLKVLIVALNYAPELVGCAKYTTELAEDLTNRGHVVRVVAGPPYYPAWSIEEPYRGTRWQIETLNDVIVHRTPLYVPATPTGLRRVAHLASFGAAALPTAVSVARRFRPEVVFAVAPALSASFAALAAAKVSNARSWLHVQDFEVDAAFELGLLRNSVARRIALNLERSAFGGFDRVSSISPKMVERLTHKGIRPDRITEFRNWVDVNSVRVFASTNTAYRKELNISPDRFVALYSGNMAAKQGLEMIGEIARMLTAAKAPITVLLCGDGPARAALQNDCAGLDNVMFIPLQPAHRLPELLGTADIHLLPQRREAADLVLPSKLTGMLASGRPIIAMTEPGAGLAHEIKDCGRAVRADAVAMTKGILDLWLHRETRLSLGAAARARAERKWHKSSILGELEAQLLHLANHQRG